MKMLLPVIFVMAIGASVRADDASDASKIIGGWRGEFQGQAVYYLFSKDGTALSYAERPPGFGPDIQPFAYMVEKGKLVLKKNGQTVATATIVKLTDTVLEFRLDGAKEGAAFKRVPLVEDPEYVSWAKFTKGTRVTERRIDHHKDGKGATIITTKKTLLTVTADEVTVEHEAVTTQRGADMKEVELMRQKPVALTTRKVLSPWLNPEALDDFRKKPAGTTKEGTATLKVGVVEFKTKTYEFDFKNPKGVSEGGRKWWVSEEVPGGFVRREYYYKDRLERTLEVTEFKKP